MAEKAKEKGKGKAKTARPGGGGKEKEKAQSVLQRFGEASASATLHKAFSPEHKGVAAELQEHGKKLLCRGGYCSALLDMPCTKVANGTHIVEFEVHEAGGGGCSFGMSATGAELSTAPGGSKQTLGLRRDGALQRDGMRVESIGKTAFGDGDKITLFYEAQAQCVSWLKNGKVLATLGSVPLGWHFAVGRHGTGDFCCEVITQEPEASEVPQAEEATSEQADAEAEAEERARREAEEERKLEEERRKAETAVEWTAEKRAERVVQSAKLIEQRRLLIGFAGWRSAYKAEKAKEAAARAAAARSRLAAAARKEEIVSSCVDLWPSQEVRASPKPRMRPPTAARTPRLLISAVMGVASPTSRLRIESAASSSPHSPRFRRRRLGRRRPPSPGS